MSAQLFPVSTLLPLLAVDYPGETASLVKLPISEASLVLRQLISETPGLGEDDVTSRLAEKLRAVLGLTVDDTETVSGLSPEESELLEKLSSEVSN